MSDENKMDLFTNSMVKNALKALSPEDVQKYKEVGESLYGGIDFEEGKILKEKEELEEAVQHLEIGLRSGLLPEELDEDEIDALVKIKGEKWYEEYGYTREEVPEPGLHINLKDTMEKYAKKKLEEHSKRKERRNLLKKAGANPKKIKNL